MSSCTSVPRCSSSTAAAPRTASGAVAVAGQLEHQAGAVARSGRRDGSERTGDRFAERRDHAVEVAVDVGEQGSLVRHVARR